MAIAGESNVVTQIASHPGGSSSDPQYGATDGIGQSQLNPVSLTMPSKTGAGTLAEILKGWFKADAQHSAVWRVEAKEDYDFRAGDQWTAEDRQLLNAQQRPHIVFNRVLTMLKAIAGMEINGRHEIQFKPVNNASTKFNELLSAASKWMGAECDAEDEQSQAFEDCCTCGMGWTESRLDFEETSRGKYIEERIDPIEMYWDRTAKKKNLEGARRLHRVRKMPLGDAMQMFPGFTKFQLDAAWAIGNELDEAKKTLEEKRKREENTTDTIYDDQYEVTVVHTQWWERDAYYLVADPVLNTKAELTEPQWNVFERRMRELRMSPIGVRMTRRVYHQAFMGAVLLKSEKAPIQRFKWNCITGEANRTKGTWFGLARVMRDPQMWANKWLSQVLHILNTTAKGGIVAEKNAFEDQREAEDTWARPDAITWVEEKAISGDKPKIMPKPGAFNPQGHLELMQFAISAIRDVTGINLELIGLKDVNQPGILEAMRKQAGMTVLATLFDSLRRYRKMVGRVRLDFIQDFFSDGRLIPVIQGDGDEVAMPLLKDKCAGEFSVIVDDAPASPNQKEQNWQIIQPFLMVFKDLLAQKPQLLGILLDYSPLPAKLVDTVKTALAQAGQQQPTPQEMLAIKQAVANILLTEGKANQANAAAKKDGTASIYDVAMARDLASKADQHGAEATADMLRAGAEAGHVRAQTAKTHAETLNTHADTMKTHAETLKTHAEIAGEHAGALHKHVQAGVEALTPIPHEPPPPPMPAGAPGAP